MSVIDNFEVKSIYIIREAKAQFKKLGVLCSFGKDSVTMLHMIKKAFPDDKIPFDVIHIDTGVKIPEIYDFRKKLQKMWDFKLIIHSNKEALKNTSPEKDVMECCMQRKTKALQQIIEKNHYDAIMTGIRRDEHAMRNIERYFSPRDKNFQWHIVRPKTKEELGTGDSDFESLQDVELWDIYASDYDCHHVRIHPLLHWDEQLIWEYIKQENIPLVPLYFSHNGKRYRSIGCEPCTQPINSTASTLDEIIQELEIRDYAERGGRAQDKESEECMRTIRSFGYM